jgi:trk system potassium uptake protein TrkA
VAIAGAGNVGQFIAADLLPAGHEVMMLEKDPAVVEMAKPSLSTAEWFVVDACEVLSLEFAGLRHADVVVAATGDDEDNLVISLLAKQEFAVPRVVARVNNPKNHGLFTEAWGVDVAVSTPHILRSLVEEAVAVGSMVHLLRFEQGHVSLLEVTLVKESPSVGRTLSDLALPMDSAVTAVVREGHVVRPRDDTILAAGDEVLVIASDAATEEVRRALVADGGEQQARQSPMLAGITPENWRMELGNTDEQPAGDAAAAGEASRDEGAAEHAGDPTDDGTTAGTATGEDGGEDGGDGSGARAAKSPRSA